MKQLTKTILALFLFSFFTVMAIGQDSSVSSTSTTTTTQQQTWYTQPWVWVVGGVGKMKC